MTQAKHTLEQWRIKLAITGPAKSKFEETGIIGTQAKDAIVKVLNLDFEDANLISAAPDLLEALQSLVNQFLQRGAFTDPEHPDRIALALAESAIAKATGGAA